MTFVLKSIFQMNMDSLLESYLKQLQIKSKSLSAILAPFIGIQVNLFRAIKILKQDQAGPSRIKQDFDAFVQDTLTGDLDKLEQLIQPYETQEEREHAAFIHDETYLQILKQENINSDPAKFDTLCDLINRMNSFQQQLYHKLKDVVLNNMPPRDRFEINFFKIYSEMLAETEMLVLTKKVRKDSVDENEGKTHVPKTKQEQEKEQKDLEDALNDENLCQICFTRELDSQMKPCLHTTCKTCIQTIMINANKCPYCNEEITSFSPYSQKK